MSNFNYTTINHIARKGMGLSMHEYALADLIYHLSNNPKSLDPGWCYASKETLAGLLDLSKQSVHSLIKKLLERGFLEKNKSTKHLRITFDWYSKVIIKDNQDSLPPTVKKLYPDSKESLLQDNQDSLHNKDISNNDKTKEPPTPFLSVPTDHLLDLTKEQVQQLDPIIRIYRAYLYFFKKTPAQVRLTDTRKVKIKARLEGFPLEEVLQAVKNASKDDFYSGKNDRNWVASIEYICRNDEIIERLRDLKISSEE